MKRKIVAHDPRQVLINGYESRCLKIVKELSSLPGSIYVIPDVDLSTYPDYPKRVPHVMSFSRITSTLNNSGNNSNGGSSSSSSSSSNNKKYIYLNEFALDVRRIAANFLRYNYYVSNSYVKLRKDILKLLYKFEELWYAFQLEIGDVGRGMFFTQPLLELKTCLSAVEEVVKTLSSASASTSKDSSSTTLLYAIDSFMNPIDFYLSGIDLKQYRQIVKAPLCFGDIISKLAECSYMHIDELKGDLEVMVSNCCKFWSVQPDDVTRGQTYIKDAKLLQTAFLKVVNSINYGLKSNNFMPRIELVIGNKDSHSSHPNKSKSNPGEGVTGKGKGLAAAATAAVGTSSGKGKSAATMQDDKVPAKNSADNSGVKSKAGSSLKNNVSTAAVSIGSGNSSSISSSIAVIGVSTTTSHESAQSLDKKTDQVMKLVYKMCIDEVKEHYLAVGGSSASQRVQTAFPFLKAVDPVQFPDYRAVVQFPMDFNRIEKKLNSGKYSSLLASGGILTSINAILDDVTLIRDNAYAYNTGVQGLEVRIMADCVVHYFKYLLKSCLLHIKSHGDSNLSQFIFDKSNQVLQTTTTKNSSNTTNTNDVNVNVIHRLLKEKGAEDVRKFLALSGYSVENMLINNGIAKLVNRNYSHHSSAPLHDSTYNTKAVSTVVVTTTHTKADSIPPTSATKKPSSAALHPKSNASVAMTEKTTVTVATSGIHEKGAGVRINATTAPLPSIKLKTAQTVSSNHMIVVNKGEIENKQHPTTSSAVAPATGSLYPSLEPVAPLPVRERLPWEQAADAALRAVTKHAYVDKSKPTTVIADFMFPVAVVDPSLAVEYRKAVKQPMDLGTLRQQLDNGILAGPEEFIFRVKLVFQNCIDYNAPHHESIYAKHLVDRCELLVQFCKWIGLEMLPVVDDTLEVEDTSAATSTDKSKTVVKGAKPVALRKSVQLEQRVSRSAILGESSIKALGTSPYTECRKLMKDLERCKNNNERTQVAYFLQPVNETLLGDYSVYVRSPIDLSTIKYKLDGTISTIPKIADAINRNAPRYSKFGEFIADLRLVFSNALKYNKAHLHSDSTGTSQKVYDAALALQEKLEGLLNLFSVHLCDRILRNNIILKEIKQREQEARMRIEKEEQEKKVVEETLLAAYKERDSVFAADFDLELKKQRTEEQFKWDELNKQRAILNMSQPILNNDEMINEMSSDNDDQSPYIHGGMYGYDAFNPMGTMPLINGFGIHGKVPFRFIPLLERKLRVLDAAWDSWLVLATVHNETGQSAISGMDDNHGSHHIHGDHHSHGHGSRRNGTSRDIITHTSRMRRSDEDGDVMEHSDSIHYHDTSMSDDDGGEPMDDSMRGEDSVVMYDDDDYKPNEWLPVEVIDTPLDSSDAKTHRIDIKFKRVVKTGCLINKLKMFTVPETDIIDS